MTLQNLPKIVIFGLKIYNLATLKETPIVFIIITPFDSLSVNKMFSLFNHLTLSPELLINAQDAFRSVCLSWAVRSHSPQEQKTVGSNPARV
jgi:hypothetical protein